MFLSSKIALILFIQEVEFFKQIMPQLSSAPLSQTQLQKTQIKAPSSLNAQKQKLEWIWRCIFLFITIGSSYFLQKIYIYQTIDYFASIRKGNIWTLMSIGVPFAVLFVWADMLSHRFFDPLCQKYYISHVKYPDGQKRMKRCYTLVKWAFTIFYYSLTTVAGFLLIQDTSFMPSWLGGSGDCTDCLRYLSQFKQATFPMQLFYGIQFGKHLGRFFQHIFIRPEGNFYEYALHHSLSSFLIFFSYMMNFWLIGIFILVIHDFSDIVLIIPRAYRDCKTIYKPLLQLQYIMLVLGWISCRIVFLSYCGVYSSWNSAWKVISGEANVEQVVVDVMLNAGILMAVMLTCLEVMQIFWTYHIITSFIEVNVSSKIAKHTYD